MVKVRKMLRNASISGFYQTMSVNAGICRHLLAKVRFVWLSLCFKMPYVGHSEDVIRLHSDVINSKCQVSTLTQSKKVVSTVHEMKAYGRRRRRIAPLILNLGTKTQVSDHHHRPGPFLPRQERWYPLSSSWVDLTVGLDDLEKKYTLSLPELEPRTVKQVAASLYRHYDCCLWHPIVFTP